MEILRSINWVDVLAVIIVFRISYVAFQDGLSHEIFPVMTVIASLVICLNYYSNLAVYISQTFFKLPIALSNFLSFLVLAVGTGYAFKLLRSILDKIIKVQWHPLIERFGGLVFGIVRAFLVASLVLMTISMAPFPYLQWSIRDKSLVGMHFLRIGPSIYEKVSGLLPAQKTEKRALGKEEITKYLVSDKSIAPSTSKKAKTAEWENL